MSYAHNFTVGAEMNPTNLQPLTLDEIRVKAPSVFATQPHESRSARYTFIPTLPILEFMMKNGFQPFKVSQSLTRTPGKAAFTKHQIRFRRPEDMVNLKVGDLLTEVVLTGSHDGTSAYDLGAGAYRTKCSNWLMVAESTVPSVHIKHQGNVLDNVIEGSYRILGDSKGVVEKAQEWRHLQLTAGEQQHFAEVAHRMRFGEESDTVIKPEQLLKIRRYDDQGQDLWTTFNRIQENAIKGGLRARRPDQFDENGRFLARGRRTTTREVRGIDQDVKLNRNLWTLAEAMAELKKGA